MTPDGIVGPQTEAALIAAGAAPPPQTSRAPAGTIPSGAGTPDIVSVRGIQVARKIAPQVQALLAAAEGEGVRLSGWGYRSTARQIELRKQHCGTSDYDIYQKPASQCTPPTAPPGAPCTSKGWPSTSRTTEQVFLPKVIRASSGWHEMPSDSVFTT